MANDITYRQCDLKYADFITTSWLPESLAKVGTKIQFKDRELWAGEWIVTSVYDVVKLDGQLDDFHQVSRRHRKATGDSLSK